MVVRQTLPSPTTQPIPFTINYDADLVDPAATYVAIGAVIDGEVLWQSPTGLPVTPGAADLALTLEQTSQTIPPASSAAPSTEPTSEVSGPPATAGTPPPASEVPTTEPTRPPRPTRQPTEPPTPTPTATATAAPTEAPPATPAATEPPASEARLGQRSHHRGANGVPDIGVGHADLSRACAAERSGRRVDRGRPGDRPKRDDRRCRQGSVDESRPGAHRV